MKKKYLLIFLVATVLLSCNKESFIESVGRVTVPPGDEENVGHYIFISRGAVNRCGEVEVFLDDVKIGKINIENTANIDCKTVPVENKILRVVVATGTHKIKIIYKNDCSPFLTATQSMETGKCVLYSIP